mmetsp:Transcript_135002/g.262897  ORF Transcript_135002/g.262897 Transcript_135002/m.262897 type:complete len:268 (+) Transcript_135002:90-893(+)
MTGFTACLFIGLVACVSAIRRETPHQKGRHAVNFVNALEFKHRLRICNAYPYSAAMDVYKGKLSLTADSSMPYKGCRDFVTPLKAGDKLEFRVGDSNAGTFSVSDLPNNDAVLFLAIHRHDTLGTAVSFESHVFANLLNAQVAIIDTYKGTGKAMPEIMDAPVGGKKSRRSERLRFDSVVAVNPGIYDVALVGQDGSSKARSSLVALNRESYVIMRTGVEAKQGPSYPEDIVIYPRSDVAALQGGAAAQKAMVSVLLAAVAAIASVA